MTVRVRPQRDLLPFDRFSLTVRNLSSGPLLAGLQVFHGSPSEDHRNGATSFTGGREVVPPGAWTDLKFPIESFGSYGAVSAVRDAREIELSFCFDRDHVGDDDVAVQLVGLDGEGREIPRGPRLTEEGLATVLARDPGAVTELSLGVPDRRRGPESRATALGLYTASNSEIHIPAPHSYPADNADQILSGRIMGQRIGMPIPWRANPLGVLEWAHFLHRHHFTKELVKAYADTGDDRYGGALDAIVMSWVLENPVPVGSNGGAGPAWETLSAAWRLREWLWIAGIVWESSSFSRQTRKVMLSSVWEHATSLMDHTGHPNNWIVVESAALALAGLCFPWFREAAHWTEVGIHRLLSSFRNQFFEDGVHFEISPLYHAICLHCLIEVRSAASRVGIPLPGDLDPVLERCVEYLAALCRPDFTWPSINDSGGYTGDYCALMVRSGEVFNRRDFTWIGTRGKSGEASRACSRAFPDAGIAVIRSSLSPDANFLVFRAGPAGAAHVHGDVLSLDVTALGRPRLVDPGITSYAPDLLTDHYRSTESHNSILVNGRGPVRGSMPYHERIRPAGGAFSWATRGDVEVVQGVCSGPWGRASDPCVWRRSVVFVKGEYWVIFDMVECSPGQEVTVCWQFAPGRVETELATSSALFLGPGWPGLKLVPLLGNLQFHVEIATGLTAPPRGWVSSHGSDFPAPSFRYTVPVDSGAVLVWLLLPFPGRRASRMEAFRMDREDGTVQIEITFAAGYKDCLSLAPGRAGSRRADAAGLLGRLTVHSQPAGGGRDLETS